MDVDPHLVVADRDARAEALDIGRSFIVQAPAGSGKTELLIQRYLALLGRVDNPEEVLAITFTRKAAAEMQARVVQALRRARAGESSDRAHEKITLAAASAVLERDRQLEWRLIDSPRRMRILTLDAFCASTAHALPLTSGIGGSANTVQGAEATSLYRAAALATLDWLVTSETAGQAAEQVLLHLDNNTDAYIAYLSRMLQTRDQWLEITGSGDVADPDAVRSRLEENIADIVRHHLHRVRRRLVAAGVAGIAELGSYAADNLLSAGHSGNPVTTLRNRATIVDARPEALDNWRGLVELLLTRGGHWRKTLTRNQGFPPRDAGQKKNWIEIIARLSADAELETMLHVVRLLPDQRYSDQQWEVLLALFRLLPLAVSELKRLFAERGVCDHTEVALAAGAALGTAEAPGEVALLMDHRIQHLLVDEMQDTSISQYQMLQTLTAGWQPGDGRTFFCVGDPMQSIYRFRNAEVGQFVQARTAGIGSLPLESLTLRRNFRSGETLVHWFNTVFGQIFPREDDMTTGAVSYADSVPVAALAGRGEYHIHPLFDADVATEANETADIIGDCLARSAEEDVAILVRSRTQLPALLGELRRRRIDYRAVEIDRLTDLPEIIDLQAITRACCHLGDRAAWLALLRSPLVGLGWRDLHALVLDSEGATVLELMNDSQRSLRLSTFARGAVARFNENMQRCLAVDRVMSLRERVESSWFQLGGPELLEDEEQLANAYRYLDVIERAEFAGTLSDPAELQQLLDDERVSSRASDGCRVQVMTMHKAKGLQFDHVVLPSLGRFTAGGTKSVLSWINAPADAGGRDMIISPVGPSFELERDRLHQYIENAQRRSDRLEQDRLLYVACTRARKTLHLVGHVALAADGESVCVPHSGSLLNRLWPAIESAVASIFEANVTAPAPPPRHDVASMFVEPALRRRSAEWSEPRPPPLPGGVTAGAIAALSDEKRVEYYWVGDAARHAGSVVHRWLQRFVERGSWPTIDELAHTDSVSRVWAQALGVANADLDAVCERVRAALQGILSDPRGAWLLGGSGFAELPLTGVLDGRPLSVIIDRVKIDGDTHWIVDYKTSAHEGGDLQGFLHQEALRYAPQLARYAGIYSAWSGATDVRTALYFPLMQQFEPVDPLP